MEILEQLYSVDINVAFEGSVKLAKYYGIPDEEILDSKKKLVSYFMD